jgi:CBS-domain-containing membrane protein
LLAAVALIELDFDQRRSSGSWWNRQFQTRAVTLYTFLEQIVADHMTRDVSTVRRTVTLRQLGDLFEKDDFNAYPVEEGSQVVGLVSKFDFLACFVFTTAHMIPRYDDLMKRTVADVMTSDFIYVGAETKLTRVLQLMVDHRLRSMPVIDSDQRLAGMISREDVMRALQRSVGGIAKLSR